MKKLFSIMLIASAFFTVSASAQMQKGMEISKQTLMDSLKISSATADSVIAIRNESMTQMKSIMSDQSLSQDDKRAKAKPIRQETQTRLKKFLNDEQMTKLQQMGMEMRKNRKMQ